MIKSLANIESGVRTLRVVLYAVIICNVVSVLFTLCYTKWFVSRQDEKIYALRGQIPIMIALNQNVSENREAEAKSQLEEFHRYFFAINPDIEESAYYIRRALAMSDASVANKYQKLEANGYYRQIVDAGIRIQYRCDSIQLDFTRYPYSAGVFGRLCIIRPSGRTIRRLITTCDLRNVSRTEDIPHGFFIENLNVVDNTDEGNAPLTIFN